MNEEHTAQKDAKSITTQLWSMANALRGNMDASEYRNYILAFIFYRYLSEHQEKYLMDQEIIDVEPGQSINDAYLEQASGENLQDYLDDISSSLGYAINPEDTWTTIVNKIANNQLKPEDFQNMFDHFRENAELNVNAYDSGDFRGIFADVNLGNSRLGENTAAKTKTLSKIVELVNNFTYKDENGHDILGDVYEYLIAEFAGNSGKKAGEFYTPHRVSMVLAKLVTLDYNNNSEQPFSVYDPAMGSGSLLLTVRNEIPNGNERNHVILNGQELNTTTYNLARMNIMMHNIDYRNMRVHNGDSLENDWPIITDNHGIEHPAAFDAVVENPPYSEHWDNNDSKLKDPRFKDYGALAPKTKADYAFLLHGLYHLKTTGTMAIVLPHGVLFRGAKEGIIRKALLEKNQIDAIIGLPEKLFYSTGIPTIIMVLKKVRDRRDVLFIDASKDFEKGKNQNILRLEDINKIINAYKARQDVDKYAHVASMDEIKENDYNLNIPRYVDTFEPEPEIDINQVNKELADVDQQIATVEKELDAMIADLVETGVDKDDNK